MFTFISIVNTGDYKRMFMEGEDGDGHKVY